MKTIAGLMLFLLSSCSTHEKPTFIYMWDMVYSPAFKAQKSQNLEDKSDNDSTTVVPIRMPVKGTVPRGYQPYAYAKDTVEVAGKSLSNPLRRTSDILKRGQSVYNSYCIVCHGPNGMGDGYVVPKYPRPPSLQSDKILNYPDGSIYHVITMGQNLMASYASQIAPADRWAIIHYLRVLQRSQHPTPDDLKAAEEEAK